MSWQMLLLIFAIILGFWAQFKVKGNFKKFSQVRSMSGMTGAQVARRMLDENGLTDISIELTRGVLSDHYDPRSRVIRLSENVANSNSLAAVGVAAHETGHAIQHANHYVPLQVRHGILPIANLGSQLLFPLLIGGFFFHFGILVWIGILLYAFAVTFQLVTLPVEFNASSRALANLRQGGYLHDSEIAGARKVLGAAAMTYVAATLASLAHLLYLIGIADRR